MSKNRWEQIHRFLTFNCDYQADKEPNSSFFDKLEPVSSLLRLNCQQAALPSSWLTVDEAMTAFKGRSSHTVKMPGKPISEGYKIWVLSCRGGYIIDWLYHSRIDGAQGCSKRKQRYYLPPVPYRWTPLAETFEVPVLLMERLIFRIPHQNWLLFLDNLFLTVELAHILLQMGVGVMGTTRKDRNSIPRDLRNIKQLNTALVYGATLSVTAGWVLCFAYQDNNTVLGMTTAYSLHRPVEDWVIKDKWRPKTTSTNYHVAKSVFGNETRKAIPIPVCIDDYNNGMNGVDNSNQLRKNLSTHQRFEHRTWRPLGYWLFDVAATNAYALWRLQQTSELRASHREHQIFEKQLIHGLLQRGPPHTPTPRVGKRSRCRWGVLRPGDCVQGQGVDDNSNEAIERGQRSVLSEIDGNSAQRPPIKRSRNIRSGCVDCQVTLCIDRACFDSYHLYIHEKAL
jgi:hypothetical protein